MRWCATGRIQIQDERVKMAEPGSRTRAQAPLQHSYEPPDGSFEAIESSTTGNTATDSPTSAAHTPLPLDLEEKADEAAETLACRASLQSRRSSHRSSATAYVARSLCAPDDDALAEEYRELERLESYRKGEPLAPGEEFLVFFESDDEPLNPRALPRWRKWACTLTLALAATAVTCQSSIYIATYDQIIPKFHTSREVATLGLSSFIFGMGIGPLFLAPLSEFYGRRWLYIVNFALVTIFIVPCAVAKNMATLIVCRLIPGVAGGAFLSIAAGSINDLFSSDDIAFPMMVYTASPFVGPELGPLYVGDGRWTFYVILIWSGFVFVAVVLFVPETYHPVLLVQKAEQKRRETGDDRWYAATERRTRSVASTVLRSCHRPMQLLLFEPMCLSLCIFSAILLGIIYLFFGAFTQTFTATHGFTQSQVGLSFLGLLVGMLLGLSTDGLWRKNFARLVRQRERATGVPLERYEPEWRLPPALRIAIAGAPCVTIGLFIFAWTMYARIHWIAPVIGSAVFAFGVMLVFSGIFTFLVQAYPLYAASALAANIFTRSMFATVFPLFGHQMYTNLGFNWASSLLAFLTLVMLPFPYIFYRYGARIRKTSRYAAMA
ncbi:hypothetical protein KEM52_004516 [Ascosphaera acerosa]|nr:hypothetical protein KEM52_004516 [Ascosphaera acerosa]